MLAFFGFVFTITLLVFVHEYGHYSMAKIFGVKIEEFSIGFGKVIFSKIDKSGVKWKICALPLGGYVKMYGDKDITSIGTVSAVELSKTFNSKSLYARFLIIAAGPIANYLLAILILSIFYFSYGKLEMPAVIGEVVQNSPAEKGGLLAGDKILKADNSEVTNFNDLQRIIMLNPEHPLELVIDRSGEQKFLILTSIAKENDLSQPKSKIGYIGIKAKYKPLFISTGIFESFSLATKEVIDISHLTLKSLGQMLTGKRSTDDIHGFITIAQESGKSLSRSTMEFVLFIAMLSINLGLINLLPVPILDGGHLLFIIYEAIAGKQLSKSMQDILLKIGMILIIFLVVISISNDIKSLIF